MKSSAIVWKVDDLSRNLDKITVDDRDIERAILLVQSIGRDRLRKEQPFLLAKLDGWVRECGANPQISFVEGGRA